MMSAIDSPLFINMSCVGTFPGIIKNHHLESSQGTYAILCCSDELLRNPKAIVCKRMSIE